MQEWRAARRAAQLMQPSGPVTLGDLVREDKLLWVFCCDCGRERDVSPATVPLAGLKLRFGSRRCVPICQAP